MHCEYSICTTLIERDKPTFVYLQLRSSPFIFQKIFRISAIYITLSLARLKIFLLTCYIIYSSYHNGGLSLNINSAASQALG